MLALSTCWNTERHEDGEAMLAEIAELGFSAIEIGYATKVTQVEGIDRFLREHPGMRVVSVHNHCPIPLESLRPLPDPFLLTAGDPAERRKAIYYTLQTLDFAVHMKAPIVVIHLGQITGKPSTRHLMDLASAGKRDTPEYRQAVAAAKDYRQRHIRQPFLFAMKSLETLLPEARQRGLTLGLEGRLYIEDIPSAEEFDIIFKEFRGEPAAYWHDTGHVQVKHELGLLDHAQWLQHFAPQLAGSHLHDVIPPCQDHQMPGTGVIPFERLTPLHQANVTKVLELSRHVPVESIRQHLPALKKLFSEKAA
ncbi:MAG: TIM barrel protein [Verrucomicrobiae bacterium]|nr:TIM barrel protein [Verrucomicrobiae bacterium]